MLSRQQLLFLQDLEAQSDPGRALVIIPLEAKHKGDPPTTYISSLKPLTTPFPLGRGDQHFDTRSPDAQLNPLLLQFACFKQVGNLHSTYHANDDYNCYRSLCAFQALSSGSGSAGSCAGSDAGGGAIAGAHAHSEASSTAHGAAAAGGARGAGTKRRLVLFAQCRSLRGGG